MEGSKHQSSGKKQTGHEGRWQIDLVELYGIVC